MYCRYKIYTKCQAGRGRAGLSPPGTLHLSCISCIYLNIFGYIWTYFGICFDSIFLAQKSHFGGFFGVEILTIEKEYTWAVGANAL